MSEAEFLENKLKFLLSEAGATYSELTETINVDPSVEDVDQIQVTQMDELEETFMNIANEIYLCCILYFETHRLLEYRSEFIASILPFISNRTKMLSGFYDVDAGSHRSDYTNAVWKYLTPLQAFGTWDSPFLNRRAGMKCLEDILGNTAVIISALKIKPNTETQVYNAVKIVAESAFPDYVRPTQSFQKKAKCYIPDILIPSLATAIEYKYAKNTNELIRTIDEILIDVNGYKDNPSYRFFYAVFYVKPGIWSNSRFHEVWHEKEFPSNWKGVYVVGT